MSKPLVRQNSLVLYKERAAHVKSVEKKKIEIHTIDGSILSVRPKDVQPLHPGPIENIHELRIREGEFITAWELLAGESVPLSDLAELTFGEFTPDSAWSAWQWVLDGLYFKGSPDDIYAIPAEDVAIEKENRQAKAAEQKAWQDFLERLNTNSMLPEDQPYLADVEALARGQRNNSRVMKALGQNEQPENAHDLLLTIGYWDITENPYPQRAGLVIHSPENIALSLVDEDRRDLTHLHSLAIDDPHTQDPDDAISIDGDRLWVHIADVAALIPPESPSDIEAQSRGTNLYLPDKTVTMLPPVTTEILGLGLSNISPAISFEIELNSDGEPLSIEVVPSWVRITRLTYEEAENQLDFFPLLELNSLARTIKARRLANGAVEINLPEVKVTYVDGAVEIRPMPLLQSRELVREIMLLTGEAVGKFAREKGIPIPFTSQDSTTEEIPAAKSLSEMVAIRRLMKPSQKTLTPAAHVGLGMEIYVQATSPLRRYLDLVVHQQLRAYIKGEDLLDEQSVQQRVGATEAVTGNARWAERRSIEHWTLVFLLQNPDWSGRAFVIEKRGRHDRILIPELGLETNLFQRKNRPLDSEIQVTVNEVNLAFLEAHFKLSG